MATEERKGNRWLQVTGALIILGGAAGLSFTRGVGGVGQSRRLAQQATKDLNKAVPPPAIVQEVVKEAMAAASASATHRLDAAQVSELAREAKARHDAHVISVSKASAEDLVQGIEGLTPSELSELEGLVMDALKQAKTEQGGADAQDK